MLLDGERQVAPELSGIRRDHTARYRWAAETLPPRSRVLDAACGVGYGAYILAEAGHSVLAVDRDAEAIAYAREHYAHDRVDYHIGDVAELTSITGNGCRFDAVVSFETIEHLADPRPFLADLRRVAPVLLASVPNEAVFPNVGYKFHHRHYRPYEFKALLEEAGFAIDEWHGQAGPESDVEPGRMGRTIIAAARRADVSASNVKPMPSAPLPASPTPKHVVILGLGPSLESYVDLVKRLGGRKAFADEVWAINALGDVVACDRVFHMDDFRVQQLRADARPESNIAVMLRWMRDHRGAIYTSRPHPDYPSSVEYPLEAVLGSLGFAYFNSTAAFAIAFAIHLGVEKLSLFGLDFTYPNCHDAEKGRACVEFWLGIAAARGVRLNIAQSSSLMDMCEPFDRRLYGYDGVTVSLTPDPETKALRVGFEERPLPTAEEIEARYDHSRHPNSLVSG